MRNSKILEMLDKGQTEELIKKLTYILMVRTDRSLLRTI